MWNSVRALGLAVALIFAAGQAQATPITRTFDFSATSFVGNFGGLAPVDPVTGNITVTFDPMGGDVTGQTTGITLNALNIALGSTLAFDYSVFSDVLTIGGLDNETNGVGLNVLDFSLRLNNASTANIITFPFFANFAYSQNSNDVFLANAGIVNVTMENVSVPEPAALGLLIVGLAGVGMVWRRRGCLSPC